MDDKTKERQRRSGPYPTRKFQLCQYRIGPGGTWRYGIAWLNGLFGEADVGVIVDCDSGQPVDAVWDYRLIDRPLSYIDLDYRG